MKKLIFIILLSQSCILFGQNIDTVFVIKTANSEVKTKCKRTFENGKVSSSSFIQASIFISQNVIDEAVNSGVTTGKFYAGISFDKNCDIENMVQIKPSDNKSFNKQVILYFDEFIEVYNTNKLKQYFQDSDCGAEKLVLTYYIQ